MPANRCVIPIVTISPLVVGGFEVSTATMRAFAANATEAALAVIHILGEAPQQLDNRSTCPFCRSADMHKTNGYHFREERSA